MEIFRIPLALNAYLHNIFLFHATVKIKHARLYFWVILMHKQPWFETEPERGRTEAVHSATTVRPGSAGVKGQRLTSASLFIWPFIPLLAYLWASNRWSCQGGGREGGSERWRAEEKDWRWEDGEDRKTGKVGRSWIMCGDYFYCIIFFTTEYVTFKFWDRQHDCMRWEVFDI